MRTLVPDSPLPRTAIAVVSALLTLAVLSGCSASLNFTTGEFTLPAEEVEAKIKTEIWQRLGNPEPAVTCQGVDLPGVVDEQITCYFTQGDSKDTYSVLVTTTRADGTDIGFAVGPHEGPLE